MRSSLRSIAASLLALTACHPSPPPASPTTTASGPATPDAAAEPPPVPPEEPTPAMDSHPAPWTVVVGDGSGNVYRCGHAVGAAPRCSYRPVTPAESSTGRYSGGDPWEVPLTPAQVEALWREIESAARDGAGHTAERAKTTVAVEVTGASALSLILRADAGAALLRVLTTLRPAGAAGPSLR